MKKYSYILQDFCFTFAEVNEQVYFFSITQVLLEIIHREWGGYFRSDSILTFFFWSSHVQPTLGYSGTCLA